MFMEFPVSGLNLYCGEEDKPKEEEREVVELN